MFETARPPLGIAEYIEQVDKLIIKIDRARLKGAR
jgi:hypothetical protein